ncbi:MAG TPA: YciI family protein [Actinophytocola sp.]|jgi:hypothetical protein|uniref:YciI family protein n=1 Tax=Actinophytocola sp. TaxID=1872138 RepID=UPI002E036237|nr:YciI family protein [Actinophytocola sp.]
MRYLMLVCGVEPEGEFSEEDYKAGVLWGEEMDRRGVRLEGHRLRPSASATTVRVRNGEMLASDGPFAETNEQILGFDLLECANLDEAIEVAAKHPVAALGSLEIRPLWTD